MKRITVLGAGRSSACLVGYLCDQTFINKWEITIIDADPVLLERLRILYPMARTLPVNILDLNEREIVIRNSDLIISILPVKFHRLVAETCLKMRKNLITASYVTHEIRDMEREVQDAGIMFLFECGLDPGLDHMTAMNVIDRLRGTGAYIEKFSTSTGGLLEDQPGSGNPWKYKFTWNPRNVVLAGKDGASYLIDGNLKWIPYNRLFSELKNIHIEGFGDFESYVNRDSIKYKDLYSLDKIRDLYRGTLRRPGFCHAWDFFVQAGMTEDNFNFDFKKGLTHFEFFKIFMPGPERADITSWISEVFGTNREKIPIKHLEWLGLFDHEPVGVDQGTPADILEKILKKKWSLQPGEKDMVIMHHEWVYHLNKGRYRLQAHLQVTGDGDEKTAMAKTVGWPLAIAAEKIINGEIFKAGISIPVHKAIYGPILKEMEKFSIRLIESEPVLF